MKLSIGTTLPEYPEEVQNQADHNAQDDGRRDGEIDTESGFRYPDVTRQLIEPWQVASSIQKDAEHKENDTRYDENTSELSHGKTLYTTRQTGCKTGFFPGSIVAQSADCLAPVHFSW
jgi:hypothetical protein